jgi:hypothetical protein
MKIMKTRIIILSVCLISTTLTLLSQEVKEIKKIESGTEFWEFFEKTNPLIEADTNAAILLFEEAFNKTDNNFTKASLSNRLGGLYMETKQFDNYLDKCEQLINSGISVFFEIRGNTYPGYTKVLEDNKRFISLLERNNELVTKANGNSTAEYFIQKPENYDKKKSYPLMMIFHGGIGNIQDNQHYWKSKKLKEEYIVAFVQGRNYLSYLKRRFGTDGTEDAKIVYEQIKKDYLIDTTKVLLSGPSAGGSLSIDLAINKHIPAQGLVLAFPVKPRSFGADEIYEAGIKGLKVSMICGENDWALERQKEMSVIFDKLEVENRIVIYPEKGHEYPDDFEEQILKSIEFVVGS